MGEAGAPLGAGPAPGSGNHLGSPDPGVWSPGSLAGGHSIPSRHGQQPHHPGVVSPQGLGTSPSSASPRPVPRTRASCTRPCTTASWPCAAAWSRSRRLRRLPPSLGRPHPTRTTATTTTSWLHRGAPRAVSRGPALGLRGGWSPRSPLTCRLRPKGDLWVSGPDLGGWGAVQVRHLTARPLLPTGAGDEGDGQTAGST